MSLVLVINVISQFHILLKGHQKGNYTGILVNHIRADTDASRCTVEKNPVITKLCSTTSKIVPVFVLGLLFIVYAILTMA